ncbi:MAG: flavin reductase [Methylococcales symbiont of Hymedesmia sp. n. MRB-2018]|nr:MAG: flavin reductase [Methylococcales symbiont of Hymedesmia sp. n. MRB-2018]
MISDAKSLMKNITHGVYLISVKSRQQQNAFTAAWLMQVSFNPLLICFSINPQNRSYKLLKESGVCCISVLNNAQFIEADHFGHSNITDKMQGFNWLETKIGLSALTDSLAYIECRVDHYSAAGDHQLVICEVINGAVLNHQTPMLYNDTEDMDKSSQLYMK